MQILAKLKPLALLFLRLTVALVFFTHGYEKLFSGTPAALKTFVMMGFPPYFAYIAGTIEFFGALLLALGLFTRVTGMLLGIQMAVALIKVMIPQSGIYAVHGYELPLILCGASFALMGTGAGLFSLDALTFEKRAARGKAKR